MTIVNRLFVPAMLCACATLIAFIVAREASMTYPDLLVGYLQITPQAAVFVLLIWCGAPFFRQKEYRDLSPRSAAAAMLRIRWPLLLLPLLIIPIFNVSYTLCKSSIPFLYPFHWEVFLERLDRQILGQDAWQITHAAIGPTGSAFLSFLYTVVWGLLLAFTGSIVIFFASVDTALRYHSARMITWIFGGVLGAAFFSSAGPVFAGLADPAVGRHYQPLLRSLVKLLAPNNPVLISQAYLRATYGVPEAFSGGGISAMPSMHVATAALWVCLAWPTKWRLPALVFWLLIWIASVHFGYHYASDGLAGSLVAWAAWQATDHRHAWRSVTPRDVAATDLARPEFAATEQPSGEALTAAASTPKRRRSARRPQCQGETQASILTNPTQAY